MRIFGNCPICKRVDTLVVAEPIVCCESCGQYWDDWHQLVVSETRLGNRLIPIDVVLTHRRTHNVFYARQQIPFARLIVAVFNAAVMVKFPGLRPVFAHQGGLHGNIRGEAVELQNTAVGIGLEDALLLRDNPVCTEILLWYSYLLDALFMESLFEPPNHILKINPRDAAAPYQVRHFVTYALVSAEDGDADFAIEAMKMAAGTVNEPIIGDHLVGLRD